MQTHWRLSNSVLVLSVALAVALAGEQSARAGAATTAGDVLQFGIPAIALGMAAYHRDLSGAGHLAASGLVTGAVVITLKVTIDERRPSGGGQGFPSGHSAAAAFATGYVHRRYGFRDAIPLYLGTGFVAWSRFNARAHRPRDLVAGIFIGLGTSFLITRPWHPDLVIAPLALDDALGVLVALRF